MLALLLACTDLAPAELDPPDSGDTAVVIVEQPGLSQGGVVSCADAALRQTEGPILLPTLGEGWDDQKGGLSGMGATVEDLDGDGILDVFLPDHSRCRLYLGQPDGTLSEEGAERLPEDCAGMGSAPADIDADGDIDIAVGAVYTPELLLINDGTGHFTDEAAAWGLADGEDPTMGVSWGDLEGDGDLDLFIANHTRHGEGEPAPPAPGYANRLLRNDGGTFTDISGTLTQADLEGYTFIGGWHDLDADGHTDLYLLNDYGDRVFGNRLLLSNGTGGLVPAPEDSGLALHIDAMGLGVGDLNGDGLPDLAISDWGRLHLMLSLEPGVWYDSALASGLSTSHADSVVGWAMQFADIDNDADLDVLATFGPGVATDAGTGENPDQQPDALWLNDGTGRFTEVAADWGLDHTGNNRGLLVADLTGDGWLDTLRRGIKEETSVIHHSRCGEAAWVTVRLVAGGNNPAGIGARIEATEGGTAQVRWVTSGSTGLASGGPLQVHFGLGSAEVLDALTVHWPDGSTSSFTNIPTRQALTITQSEAE